MKRGALPGVCTWPVKILPSDLDLAAGKFVSDTYPVHLDGPLISLQFKPSSSFPTSRKDLVKIFPKTLVASRNRSSLPLPSPSNHPARRPPSSPTFLCSSPCCLPPLPRLAPSQLSSLSQTPSSLRLCGLLFEVAAAGRPRDQADDHIHAMSRVAAALGEAVCDCPWRPWRAAPLRYEPSCLAPTPPLHNPERRCFRVQSNPSCHQMQSKRVRMKRGAGHH